MVSFETVERERWILTDEGKETAQNGSHEAKVFNVVPECGMTVARLQVPAIFIYPSL